MKLSIIIVSYNVEKLLFDCLTSLVKASKNINTEIFVVDNNSNDDSCNMVNNKFPFVKLIENKINVGFSTANNQAIKQSKGEYILILNPDTIVYENTLDYCLDFCEKHKSSGAIGVKMINDDGEFLPESKRSFPSPLVSFYRIIGLSKIFNNSPVFNKYYLSYLNENENHIVDTLAGAFMWIKKTTLENVGFFDESFFMYGEDIDLSYRIQKSGLDNYYLGKTSILHYKGESTNKLEYKYVLNFYGAMKIFSKKHFKNGYLMYNSFVNVLISLHLIKLFFLRLFNKKID
jgi:GT2 family glycosyltransferase